MAEIVNEHQVAINDLVFAIEGRVQRFVASQFAQKQVIGGYDDESDPVLSTLTIDNFNGGIGKDKIESPGDVRFSMSGTAYIHLPGKLTLAPSPRFVGDTTADSAVSGSFTRYEEFGGTVWAADSGFTRDFDISNDSWGPSSFESGYSNVSHFKAGFLNDSSILVIAGDSGAISFSNTPTDSTTWSSDSSHNTTKVEFLNDFLWGITSSGELAFTPDISSGWTDVARLTSDTSTIVDMLKGAAYRDGVIEDALYVVTLRGLHRYDNQNERFKEVLKFPPATDASATEWNGSIYYSQDKKIFRVTPGPVDVVESVSPPYFRNILSAFERYSTTVIDVGNIVAMDAGPGALYTIHRNDTTTSPNKSAAVFEFNGRAWSELPGFSTGVASPHDVLVSGVEGRQRIYFSQAHNTVKSGTHAFDRPILATDILTDTNIIFPRLTASVSQQHAFPWFDGFLGQPKLAASISVSYDINDTDEWFLLQYRADETTSFKTVPNSQTFGPGIGTATFPLTDTEGNRGIEFDRIQLAILLGISSANDSHDNHTPVINRVSLNYIKSQSLRWGFRVGIKAAEGQSQTELFASLENLFESTGLFEFTYRGGDDGNPQTYNVKAVSLQSAESTGWNSKGDYALTLVQAV